MKRRPQEKPEDYGARIKKLTRLGYPDNKDQQEEEGVSAFKEGIKDDPRAAEGIVLQKFKTVQECVEALSDLERFRQSSGKQQPHVRLRPLESEQAGNQPQGGGQGSKGQSPAETATERALNKGLTQVRGELAQVSQNMKWMMDQWLQSQGQPRPVLTGSGPPGQRQPNFQGLGRGGRVYREFPSEERPCEICKATDHWKRRCPQRGQQNRPQQQGNGAGLDQRSVGQSNQTR